MSNYEEKSAILIALDSIFTRFETGADKSAFNNKKTFLLDNSNLDETAVENARAKISAINSLNYEDFSNWRKNWLTFLRQSSNASINFTGIHPEHVLKVIKQESPQVQNFILMNLPEHISAPIRNVLDTSDVISLIKLSGERAVINEEMSQIIKESFLSNFVFNCIDFPIPNLEKLDVNSTIRLLKQIGLEELALVCAKTDSVFKTASVIKNFGKDIGKQLAIMLPKLKETTAERSELAEFLTRAIHPQNTDFEYFLEDIGVKVFSFVLQNENKSHQQFFAQRLSLYLSERFDSFINGDQNLSVSQNFNTQIESVKKELSEEIKLLLER